MRAIFAIPGDISLRTGANGYNRRIIGLMADNGIHMHHLELPAALPLGTAADFAQAGDQLAAIHAGTVLLIDSLGFSSLPAAQIRRIRAPVIALVHHPLSLESGLDAAQVQALQASERAALGFAQEIVVTSAYTGRLLEQDFAVPAVKITVAEPGTARAARANPDNGAQVHLLAVGSLIPRKGYDVLFDALASLPGLNWRLTIAGGDRLDPAHAAHVHRRAGQDNFAKRIEIMGEIPPEQLEHLYAAADVFVMPSLFEGYGMALTEAMMRGLPILCTTGGAAAETVPDGAGLKVPPGDAAAFAKALQRLIVSKDVRQDMAEKSWVHGQSLPDWGDSARKIAGLVKRANGTC